MSTPASEASPTPDPQAYDVALEHLRVEFGQPDGTHKTVIHDLNLTISSGEFVAIVGRSGCGKTTILNLIAGLVDQAQGSITVLGTAPRLARRRLGFMLARDALLPWRTAQGNVEFGLQIRGVPKAERRALARRALAGVHLAGSERLWPWQLSQGMRQRVALARTWVLDPSLLLMDEPFAALDVNTRRSVQEEFLRLWQSQPERTVVLVTHDLNEAISLADRVIVLGRGVVVGDYQVGIERPRGLRSIQLNPRFQELHQRIGHDID